MPAKPGVGEKGGGGGEKKRVQTQGGKPPIFSKREN